VSPTAGRNGPGAARFSARKSQEELDFDYARARNGNCPPTWARIGCFRNSHRIGSREGSQTTRNISANRVPRPHKILTEPLLNDWS
jgi:hypothetical protein